MRIDKKVSVLTVIMLFVIDACMLTFWFVPVSRWVRILFGIMCLLLTLALVVNSVLDLLQVKREINAAERLLSEEDTPDDASASTQS